MKFPWTRRREAEESWEDTTDLQLELLNDIMDAVEENLRSGERRLNTLEKVVDALGVELREARNEIRELKLKVK